MDWTTLQQRTNAAAMAAFGRDIVLDGLPVRGDFHEPADQVFLDRVSAVATRPQVVVDDADVPEAPVGKRCQANGQQWLVADARPDGCGMTVLILERAL